MKRAGAWQETGTPGSWGSNGVTMYKIPVGRTEGEHVGWLGASMAGRATLSFPDGNVWKVKSLTNQMLQPQDIASFGKGWWLVGPSSHWEIWLELRREWA